MSSVFRGTIATLVKQMLEIAGSSSSEQKRAIEIYQNTLVNILINTPPDKSDFDLGFKALRPSDTIAFFLGLPPWARQKFRPHAVKFVKKLAHVCPSSKPVAQTLIQILKAYVMDTWSQYRVRC